jgi:hypothetical protein
MRKGLGVLAVAAAALLASAGCTLLPTSHASFDAWLEGDPDRDYDTLNLESIPALRMVYGPLLAVPYATRDLLRVALAPLGFLYFTAQGLDAVPGSAFVGPRRPMPPLDLPGAERTLDEAEPGAR